MAEKEYKRLPGSGRLKTGIGALMRTSSRLYLAKDHLLRVDSMGWIQKYKRFYFSDIQALVICKTKRSFVWNIVLGVISIICFAAFMYWWFEPLFNPVRRDANYYTGAVAIGGLLLFFVILFLVNFLRGPTARVQIQTPVSTEELPSLNRLRTAQKVLAQIRPFIEQAQGATNPDELPAKLAEMSRNAPARIIPGAGMPGSLRSELNYRGAIHAWLFTLMLELGMLTGLSIFHNQIAITFLVTTSLAAAAILAIVALVKQHQSSFGGALKGVTWGAMALICICGLIGYVNFIIVAVQHPNSASNQLQLLKLVNESYSINSPWRFGSRAFVAVSAICLGASGLLLLRNFRIRARFQQPADNTRYDY